MSKVFHFDLLLQSYPTKTSFWVKTIHFELYSFAQQWKLAPILEKMVANYIVGLSRPTMLRLFYGIISKRWPKYLCQKSLGTHNYCTTSRPIKLFGCIYRAYIRGSFKKFYLHHHISVILHTRILKFPIIILLHLGYKLKVIWWIWLLFV